MRNAILTVVALVPSLAAAEPPGLVIPVPTPQPMIVVEAPVVERTSYRWQVLAVDAAAIGAIVLADRNRSESWGMLGVGTYALGAPLVHAGNGHTRRALGSLALRITMPILTGLVGTELVDNGTCIGNPEVGASTICEGRLLDEGFAKGMAVGAVIAIALDGLLIARPETKIRKGWSPNAAATRTGVSIGVSGSF